MRSSFQLNPKLVLTVSLFLIASLHTMIFSFFQIPENFFGDLKHIFTFKILLYCFVIATSCSHQLLMKVLDLKFTLIAGLLCNGIALSLIWLNIQLGGYYGIIVLNTIFIGLALPSVLNCLITYLVIEYPKKTGLGVMALFAFANLGNMSSNLLFAFLSRTEFIILSLFLLTIAILFIYFNFFDSKFPKHLEHLRKGTLIWKELHYRLGLFIIAIISYGIVESTFGIWGEIYLTQFISDTLAKETISIFWFSLIIGQILLLLPLYLYPARKIFNLLVLTLVIAIFFFQHQTHPLGIILSIILIGFSCAAIFPILLSFMETEIYEITHQSDQYHFLPFIEIGISFMLGGYFLGVGIIDLWADKITQHPSIYHSNIYIFSILCISIVGLIGTYLNWSFKKTNE